METEKNTGLPEIQVNEDEILFKVAKDIVVSDEASFVSASDIRLKLNARLKEGKAELSKVCDEYNRLHKASTAHRTKKLAPYIEAMYEIDKALDAYEAEQERKRQEKEAKLQEEAREQEEAARLAEAEVLEANGHTQEAEAVISEEVYVPPVVVPTQAVKVGGIGKRKSFKFRFLDKSKINPAFLIPNEMAIAALVRTQGKQALQSVGAGSIEIYEETKRYGTGR